jgi:hypothetical protein
VSHDDHQSLSDRARELGVTDPDFLRKADKVEGAASSKAMSILRNGDFPRWSPERWLLIASVVYQVSTNLFDVGGYKERMENRMTTATDRIVELQQTIDVMRADVVTIRLEQSRVRTELDLDSNRRPPTTTPRFSPEWSR